MQANSICDRAVASIVKVPDSDAWGPRGYSAYRHTASSQRLATLATFATSQLLEGDVRSRLYCRARRRGRIGLMTFLIFAALGVRGPLVNAESGTGNFNFVLANAGSQSVARGSSVTNAVAAILMAGFSKTVPLPSSRLPAGAGPAFSVTPLLPT